MTKLCPSKHCRLGEIGIQIEDFCATGEWKRMLLSHLTHFFCFVQKRLASNDREKNLANSKPRVVGDSKLKY